MRGRRALAEAWEALRIAAGTLASARLRSSLTTLGIVIGVMTVIAIVAIIQGLDRSFQAQVANLGSHTLYVDRWKWLTGADEWWTMRNRRPIGKKELEALQRECTLATAIAPMTRARATVSRGALELTNVAVNGTNTRYLDTGGGAVGAGRFLVESDLELARAVVVLGADVTDRLFPGVRAEAALGQRVLLAGRPFTVVGLMERRGRFLGLAMDNNVSVPLSAFEKIFGDKRSLQIAATAAPGDLPALEDELTAILRRVRAVSPDKPDDFAMNRQEQFLKVYGQLTGALYGVAVGVGLITLVVGGIGIMNIMLVSVHERTREIGVRRALGARRGTILFQFLLEASFVAAIGGAVGTALGLGAALLISLVTPLAAAATPTAVLLGLGFSTLVGLVFGSWPAWRAANLDPVEALRYE